MTQWYEDLSAQLSDAMTKNSVSSTLWRNDQSAQLYDAMTCEFVSSTLRPQWPGNLSAQLLWRNDLQISTLWRNDLGICQRNSMSQLSRNLSTQLSNAFDLGICQLNFLTQWPGYLSDKISDAMTWASVSSTTILHNDLGICQFNSCDAMTWESVSSTLWRNYLWICQFSYVVSR